MKTSWDNYCAEKFPYPVHLPPTHFEGQGHSAKFSDDCHHAKLTEIGW